MLNLPLEGRKGGGRSVYALSSSMGGASRGVGHGGEEGEEFIEEEEKEEEEEEEAMEEEEDEEEDSEESELDTLAE